MARRSSKGEDPKLQPFIELGFISKGRSGDEVYGECVFCGKDDKLYINTNTQQWHCKNAKCDCAGNIYTFIEESYKRMLDESDTYQMDRLYDRLAENRKLPVSMLMELDMVWDGHSWRIPYRNYNGTFVQLRHFKLGQPVKNLGGVESALFGLHLLASSPETAEIWICEGEWDWVCLKSLVSGLPGDHVVLAVPGSGVFKDSWLHYFKDRVVHLCYDNDAAGMKGRKRAGQKLDGVASAIDFIDWPDGLPDKYDVRDFYNGHGGIELFVSMLTKYIGGAEVVDGPQENIYESMPKLSSGDRPSFQSILDIYHQHLHMSPEMEDALKVVYAIVLSNQVEGDPLWVHIAGPPGSGKTELLMSTSGCVSCRVVSTLTPHSLVSGFNQPGGKDPSLIPQLMGKTFVLKDFTEVLQMQRQAKDDIYNILRGAYDGEVIKPYGNGLIRHYKGHFSMVTGVTHAIFAENGTSLGERFLVYHFVKGVGIEADELIMAALTNSGNEKVMKQELSAAAKSFLEYRVDGDVETEVPMNVIMRLIGLSQFVSMLRGTVERGFDRERLRFRPQHEMGTRLAKQMKKLLTSLALVNDDFKPSEKDYSLVVRIALDTCNGFNLDIVKYLISFPESTVVDISRGVKIPVTTCREHLEDMEQLNVVVKATDPDSQGPGRPSYIYSTSDVVLRHWNSAEISKYINGHETIPKQRKKFRKSSD